MQAQDIMTENPACCTPSDSLRTVAQFMRDNNCGMIPVVTDFDDMKLIGIITDRDIVCRVLAIEHDCNTAIAKDAMTTGTLWTVHPESSVDEVIERMEEGQVRRIPVVDANSSLLGVISTADIALELDEPEEIAEVFEEISEPTHSPHA